MFTRFFFATAMAVLVWPAVGWSAPLTLDQALALAAQRSPLARASRAGAAGAAESARAASQLPDPMLSVGIENLPFTGADRFNASRDFMTMKKVGISQEWVSLEKRSTREAAALALASRETTAEKAAQAEARLQAALAFVDAYYAQEALRLTTLTEHHVHEEFEAAKARLASSAGASQEALALTAARGIAQDESADIRQSHAAAAVALQRWVGFQPDELAAPVQPVIPEEEAYIASNPTVLGAQRDIEVAGGEAAVAATYRHPNWTWQVAYAQRTGFSDMVSFGVSIPLPVAPAKRQDRETASKLALVEKAEANLEEARRMAGSQFRSLASDAQRLAMRIDGYRSAVVLPAQQRIEAALAGYRSNQVALMALFEARHAEVDAQRKLLNLQRDLARVQAQLAFRPVAGALQ
jgi:outer membrane protein TolC